MLLKIAVRHFEKGPGKLGTDEWILMKDVGQEQQAAQLKILPSSVNFPEYYLEIETGATFFSNLVLIEPQGNHI